MSLERNVFTLGHSPDPDDAFMFYAMAENKIDLRGYRFEHRLEDIQTLNERALRGELHISAISIHAYAYAADKYALLPCGASMGDGYGPIVVRKHPPSNAQLRKLSELGVGWWVFSDHNWSVAIAHARAARQQCIFIRRIRIRVNRDGRNVKLAAECPFIQRLDILESMFETITTKIDLVFRHRVEHECVVRIGGVSECENVPLQRHGRTLSLR